MDWYGSLSDLLLDDNLAEPRLQEPRHNFAFDALNPTEVLNKRHGCVA
jgi:hypothetical protein